MQIIKKLLTDGCNGDDSVRLIGEREALNLMNCRVGISRTGRNFQIRNTYGTTLLNSGVLPAGTNQTIGSCTDDARQFVIYFNHNSNGTYGIYAHDTVNVLNYTVITDSQITGGLNFSKSYRIDRNAYVIGDLLFWTDNNNEPKCINYIAAIKTNHPSFSTSVSPYTFPIKYESSTLIVRPPIYVLSGAKQTDSSFTNNFTANNAYQFTYRYVYRDYQVSALAEYSALIPYNYKADTYNNVLVKVPFAEFVDLEVLQINLCVKYGNSGKTFIVKTWDRGNSADAAQITAHNAGTTQLQYTLYDNVVGIALDDVTSITSAHSVPLTTKTMAPAKGRMFLANNKAGYTSPVSSMIAATLTTAGTSGAIFKGGGTIKLSIQFFDRFKRKCGAVPTPVSITIPLRTYSQTTFASAINWSLYNTYALNEIPDWAYYYQILWSKNLANQFFIQGATQEMYYAQKDNNGVYTFTETVFNNTSTAALAVSLSSLTALGMGYTYSEGDFATIYRYTGTNYTAKVIGTYGNYALLSPTDIGKLINNYSFTLLPFSYVNAADTAYLPCTADNPVTSGEITVASAPLGGLNQDPPNLGVTNFIIKNDTLAAKTFTVTGSVTFTVTGTSVTYPNIAFRVAATDPPASDAAYTDLFTQAAVPGTYTKTFSVTVTVAAGYNRISLIGFFPDVVTVALVSGSINFTQTGGLNLFEIFTPNKENVSETYFGVGDVYPITMAGTAFRTYSTTSGTIGGDAYLVSRSLINTAYITEAMSPNDLTWKLWERSLGFVNVVDTLGQQTLTDSIAFSDTYINGTKTNGLSTFQPLNKKDIGSSGGQIQKIILANKRQEDGSIMLIITDNNALSVYLGETQVVAASKNAYVSVSDGVIGTINELRGNYGTINPESVVSYLGDIFWVDRLNGVAVQYAQNGLVPISDYKMSRFFGNYLKDYTNLGAANITAINGFSHIPTSVDPFHGEFWATLPALIYSSYANLLPSYSGIPAYATSINNRFDIYDSLGKTMCFNYESNKWVQNFEFMPEWTERVGMTVYGFKNGSLYSFGSNATALNTYFGTQYPVRVCLTANANPSQIKDVFNIAIEGNAAPDFTVAYSDWPNTQISDLISGDYKNKEGVFYAAFLRDRLSPNASGTAEQKLYKGDFMKDAAPKIMLEFQQYTSDLHIDFIDIGVSTSGGHGAIAEK